MILPRDRHLGRRSRVAGRGQSGIAARTTIVAIGVCFAVAGGPAEAVSIDDPHIGGIGFSGPTTGDLAAVYWNPAALGLMHGLHLTFAGTGRLSTTRVSRASIDPATGLPGPGVDFPDSQASDRSHPFIWPPGPGAFAGISTDVGGDRFALGFAAYMPFVERSAYESPAGTLLPTRYHRIAADLRNLALVPALAVRFAGDFRLGFAPGFLFSTGRLSFDESTCASTPPTGCGEAEAGDARANLGSGLGLSSSKFAYTLGGGLYFRVRAWEFGFSYSSRPLGGDVGGSAVIGGNSSQITLPQSAGGGPLTCLPYGGRTAGGIPDGSGCVFADIVYKLPATYIAGVTWHPRPGWDVAGILRILSFASNDVIDIRLTGPTLAAAGIPQHIVLHRGYGTVLDTRLRVGRWINERLRVGAGVRVESSALPDQAVSAASVDGGKLEPTVMMSFGLAKHLWVGGGYGFTYMLPVTVSSSVFNPTQAATCAQAGGDLGTNPDGSPRAPACTARLDGTARPTAAGTYRHFEHDFSLSVTAQF